MEKRTPELVETKKFDGSGMELQNFAMGPKGIRIGVTRNSERIWLGSKFVWSIRLDA